MELPKRFYHNYINIPYAYKITRFQDQLYVLAKHNNGKQPIQSDGFTWWETADVKYKDIYEIFLHDTTL